jgi:hypothetical protein
MSRFCVLFVALGVAACGGEPATQNDASVQPQDSGHIQADAAASNDGGLLVADFVAEGCERLEVWGGDGGVPDDGGASGKVCVGHAPLTLTFIPVTTENVDSYVWTFGEPNETPKRDETPTHTYVLPGSFAVTLTVGGPAGTLTVKHEPPFVRVLPDPTGWPCDRSEQCAAGLDCTCPHATASDTSCPAAFGVGALCTRECASDADCGTDSACVDLDPSHLTGDPPWRAPLCLATCASTTVCPTGLSCRSLPAAQGLGTWVSACFPEFLGDVGAPCLDADGQTEPLTCVGGVCLEVGSSGYCSAACDPASCPAGSACAVVGAAGGHSMCLASCESTACDGDPLLGCEAPDPSGRLGFELVGVSPPAGATYCAPRRCTGPADCQGLRCEELDGASFCQPSP